VGKGFKGESEGVGMKKGQRRQVQDVGAKGKGRR
jgi:hypothetical protein